MNSKVLLTVLALSLTVILNAQSNVYLQIQHFLGDDEFSSEMVANNSLGEEFMVERMEYYLSEIIIVHDGGTETPIEDLWVLANAFELTNVYLGNFDITNVEEIRFGVGVQESVNHLDPTTYPSDHPLAPKSPSMHWGWAAGYRFVAMEGDAGDGMSQIFEIHALGDANYNEAAINILGMDVADDIYIVLEADYSEALYDVSVEGGLINHGETGEAAQVLENFASQVFSAGSNVIVPTSINDEMPLIQMSIAPNPATEKLNVQIDHAYGANNQLILTDVQGKNVKMWQAQIQQVLDISEVPSGLYYLSLTNGENSFASYPVYINK